MRLFTAIDIPAEVKERLKEFVQPLRLLAKISWSPIDNLHVTTKFIGEWPEHGLVEMKSALAQVPRPGSIEISVQGIGWFPNARNPRVFWAGIVANASLGTLAQATEHAVVALGVAEEKRVYSPHLTLARIREKVSLDALQRAVQVTEPDFGSFRAEAFFLYLSRGGKYTKLAEFAL